jgi:hypothetical protein
MTYIPATRRNAPVSSTSTSTPILCVTALLRKRVDRMILPFCIKSPFLLLVLANQDFLVGLPLWQMKENQRCRPTVTEWL